MSASILVVEYEPRYVERIRKALSGPGYRLEVVGDVDAAVEVCANFEPDLVVITSVLPRLKIEDAVTQLRARAGLPTAPFLLLMSGYRGENPKEDAIRYGAQDILERPFAGELLIQRVERLLQETKQSPAATQAIPQDMLEALRRSAGLADDGGVSLTSDDLFGDILSDVNEDSAVHTMPSETAPDPEPELDQPTVPVPMAAAARKPSPAPPSTGQVADALANMLDQGKAAPPIRRAAPPSETDVDMILSQTLAGLDIQPIRARAKKKEDAPAAPPQAPAAPPARPSEPTAVDVPKVAAPAPPPPVREERPVVPPPPPPAPAPAPPKERDKVAPPVVAKEVPAAKEPVRDKVAPPPPRDAGKDRVAPPAPVKAAAAESSPSSGGTQFGQYILHDHIATGGMAEVYQARMMGMEGFQKTVAIKRILPHLTDNDEFVTMFIDEAKLAAQLNHNNIIHIYDLGKIDRSYYIAMEYIDGRDLRSILQECRERSVTPPIALSLHVATLLASALDYAHKKRDFENRDLGLVHRDVSPQNVLISSDGVIKLCDFGIAKAASKASHTRAGALKGKLQYMSPEQAWGKDIDHRSDIFSLGVVLYEMLTGSKVFAGDSELSILEQVRNPQVPPASQRNSRIPEDVEQIVMKALEPDRDRRYQSARDLQRDIERVMRKRGWAPGAADVSRFVDELCGGREVTGWADAEPEPVKAAVPPPSATKPAAPAPVKPAPLPPVVMPDTEDFELSPSKKKGSRKDKKQRRGRPEDERPSPAPVKAATTPSSAPARPKPEPIAVAEPVAAGDGGKKPVVLIAGVVALIIAVAALAFWFRGGSDETPATPTPTEGGPVAVTEPTPSPTVTQDIEEMARQIADAAVAQQEDEMRRRIEAEYSTPTAPPAAATATPVPSPTPTPEPQATATPRPTNTPPPQATATPTAVPATPTPSVREGDVVTPGAGVTLPAVVQQVEPEFPPMAKRMRADGEVEIEVLVGVDGRVEDVRLLSVSRKNLGFEDATINAVKQWRYKPATKNGVKVRMWVKLRVPFRTR